MNLSYNLRFLGRNISDPTKGRFMFTFGKESDHATQRRIVEGVDKDAIHTSLGSIVTFDMGVDESPSTAADRLVQFIMN